ncbi:DUF7507 domain-containing protein [Cohnella fermenti]|nr:DUF11 domain-containing protein [Cohnella fermenti]
MNPVFIGGYDEIRPTNDPAQAGYWIGSGTSVLFDAALNGGAGGTVVYEDLIRISKGAELQQSEQCDCVATVTLDIQAKPATFGYFPPHSLDVVFVLDVTSSMMSGASTKFVQAKRAMVNTINQLWASNRDTTVTIVPYGRAAFLPNASPATGFAYDYTGSLFTWKRSSAPPPGGTYYIGQILGYRNQSFVGTSEMAAFLAQTEPLEASAERSLYNSYNYYKIRYSDIYDADGNPLPDSVLSDYIANVYTPEPAAYSSNQLVTVAAGTSFTPIEATYAINPDYPNNSILQNLIWAIPYSEDTNTESGLTAAYELFKTPGFAQSNDINRRVVILITDGQANRSINPSYPTTFAAPGDTDATFFPDVAGEPWKYFTYLQQTMAQLVAEITNRSSTFEEIGFASTRAQSISDKLKSPADGNTQLYALGIDISAQSPGPYTREDVIELMQSWVSAPSFFHEANTSDPESQIAEVLAKLVADIFNLYAGSQLVLNDAINTALFSYVPGTIAIRGVRNGLKLKSPNQPDITDPLDPDFTVYPKAPLLPDVDDSLFVNGALTLPFGPMPLGLLTQDSLTTVTLAYQVRSNPFANGFHLHTNADDRTFVSFIEPNHLVAVSSVIDYGALPKDVFFHTPVVSCECAPFAALAIEKTANVSSAKPGEAVEYAIRVTNTGTLALTNLVISDPLLGIDITIGELPPLQDVVIPVPHTIPAGTPEGPYPNTASVTTTELPDPRSATETIRIELTPSLLVSKAVNTRTAKPGETVVFTIAITNNGNSDLMNVHLVDALLGIDATIEQIVKGATVNLDFPYTIPEDSVIGTAILNVAVVRVEELPPITVGVTVTVVGAPRLILTKTADRNRAKPGDVILFTLTATNTGDEALTNVRITDPTLALSTTIPFIAAGQSVSVPVDFRVPLETLPRTYVNTSTAVSDQTEPAVATEEVEVLPQPAVALRKTADRPTVRPGETIVYTILVGNFGNVPLGPFALYDPLLGIDMTIDGLAVGDARTFDVSYTAPADSALGSAIVNLITADSPEAGIVQAEATVIVAGDDLQLAKITDKGAALPGETVVYTIVLTNVTALPQTNVRLIDAELGIDEVIPALLPGASVTRIVPRVMPNVPDHTVLHNVASARSDQTPTRYAEADVTVESELTGTELRVTKIPSGNVAPPGQPLVYTVTVENVGVAAATNVIVRDSLTGFSSFVQAIAPGGRVFLTFSYDVPPGTPQGVVVHNQVLVTSPQTNPTEAEADVVILLRSTSLRLTKTVDPSVAAPGSVVSFFVTVTNTTTVPLTDVRVFDNLASFQTSIPVLAPGETRSYVLPFRIPDGTAGGTVFLNVATAFSAETPFIQEEAEVAALEIPQYAIGETVDRPVVRPEETVFFTIVIRNTGNVGLINFGFEAPLLSIVFRTRLFRIGDVIRIRVPFKTPDTDEEIVIVSPVYAHADNAGPQQVSAQVLVIPEEEE